MFVYFLCRYMLLIQKALQEFVYSSSETELAMNAIERVSTCVRACACKRGVCVCARADVLWVLGERVVSQQSCGIALVYCQGADRSMQSVRLACVHVAFVDFVILSISNGRASEVPVDRHWHSVRPHPNIHPHHTQFDDDEQP